MRRGKLLQWGFIGVFTAAAMTLGNGPDSGIPNWLTTASSWFLAATVCLVALVFALGALAWILKALGVIAALPDVLDRKIRDQQGDQP